MKAPSIPLRETLSGPLEQLLLFSVLFVALPHAVHLTAPVFGFFAAMVAWRFAAGLRPGLLPGKIPLAFLTVGGGLLVFAEYHRFYGRDGGAALFLVGLGLKLMEMKTRREIYLVIFLAFFVALTQYLFSQSIPMAAYTLAAVGLSVAVLIGVNSGNALAIPDLLRRSGALVAQAVPLMVVLFLFFPRIPGPLWHMPDDERRAKIGLSDIMEPGSISHLSESDEPAFRADFQGEPPPPGQRYWRGPVFWQTDGTRWTLPSEQPLARPARVEFAGPSYRYTVTLEPHTRKWVYALDLPSEIPPALGQTADFLLLAKDKLEERSQFTLASRPEFRTGPLSDADRRRALQLPGEPAPRLRELVDGWKAASPEPRAIVSAALKYFRAEPFVYTLNPPKLPDRPVERFLFETRRGFCEHYATAFVTLMRVAGVPARVVGGYQGGAWNPIGRFLEVRQADAHAWAEVWLENEGWTRVDPTAAVAPERIEQGIDFESQSAAGDVRFNPVGEALAEQAMGLRDWLRSGRQAWASVDHAWNLWVLAYNPENQKRFWEALGIVDWRTLAVWLGGLLTLCGLAAAYLFRPKSVQADDPAVKAYRRFQAKLARRGVERRIGEGPVDFARRAAAVLPEAAEPIAGVTEVFLRLRYGREPAPADLERLRRKVRELRA
jgi:transglutaminase-like putative cysteine protease/dolichol kinase